MLDDTTVVGLISGGDESAYRDKVVRLSSWCKENNLLLNTSKTKELISDYRRKKSEIPPLIIQKLNLTPPFNKLWVFKLNNNIESYTDRLKHLEKSNHPRNVKRVNFPQEKGFAKPLSS